MVCIYTWSDNMLKVALGYSYITQHCHSGPETHQESPRLQYVVKIRFIVRH